MEKRKRLMRQSSPTTAVDPRPSAAWLLKESPGQKRKTKNRKGRTEKKNEDKSKKKNNKKTKNSTKTRTSATMGAMPDTRASATEASPQHVKRKKKANNIATMQSTRKPKRRKKQDQQEMEMEEHESKAERAQNTKVLAEYDAERAQRHAAKAKSHTVSSKKHKRRR